VVHGQLIGLACDDRGNKKREKNQKKKRIKKKKPLVTTISALVATAWPHGTHGGVVVRTLRRLGHDLEDGLVEIEPGAVQEDVQPVCRLGRGRLLRLRLLFGATYMRRLLRGLTCTHMNTTHARPTFS
jgi:hypothetical protein